MKKEGQVTTKKHLTKNDNNCSNVELLRVQRLLKITDHKQMYYDR